MIKEMDMGSLVQCAERLDKGDRSLLNKEKALEIKRLDRKKTITDHVYVAQVWYSQSLRTALGITGKGRREWIKR